MGFGIAMASYLKVSQCYGMAKLVARMSLT